MSDYLIPVIICALVVLLVYLIKISRSTGETSNLKEISFEELSKHNGENGSVYVGVKNLVFDVSSCEAYFAGGNYSIFAGKDATLALARMSLDPALMNKEEPLNTEELKTLNEWIDFYKTKKNYPVVGILKKSKKNL